MIKQKTKTTTIITLFLILCITATSITLLTPVKGATTYNYKTFAYLSIRPNPIGVGQTLLINFWITPPMPQPGILAHGYTIEIIHPDGTKETLGPFNSIQADTSMWTEWTPKTVGNYTLKVIYPGETVPPGTPYQSTVITSAYSSKTVDTYVYPSAESPVTKLVVQQEPIPGYQPTPLPTEYWSRPVSIENREWSSLMGDWVMSSNSPNQAYYQPNGGGPDSAHILWVKTTGKGGIVGDVYGDSVYSGDPPSTSVYQYMKLAVDGMGYYSAPDGLHCVNLHTGEELWVKQGITANIALVENYLVRAQGPPVDSYNAYLMSIGTTLLKWDAYTGELIVNVTGMSGTYDPTPYDAGDYGVQTYVYSTQTIGIQRYLIKWTPQGNSNNFTSRIAYNVTYPLGGITGISGNYGFYYGVTPDTVNPSGAFDIKTGHIVWTKNYTINDAQFSSAGVLTGDGIYVYPEYYGDPNQQGLRPLEAIDISNGNILFNSTVTTYPWGSFWSYSKAAAYGMVYYPTYSGYIWAFNATSGQVVWKGGYNAVGYETPYGYQPFFSSIAVAGGKVYAGNDEHSEQPPYYQGKQMWCLDAYTGETIWNISFWSPGFNIQGLIADGILVATNFYDGRQYAFGKGQSATTIAASPEVTIHGSSVMITGTVNDVSPSAKDDRAVALYPNGVPCVSEESQSAFMEYVYMQKAKPMNTSGVPVTLTILDSNGNYRDIGTAISNADGFYSLNWTPDIDGKYTVYASFSGSNSYWPSQAVTAFAVDPAAATPTATTAPIQAMTDLYFVPAVIGIIVTIIIGFVALALLLLRKRP